MAMLLEEISLRQKSCSCMLWLKGVDKNAKFFHSLANSHHQSNTIGWSYVNGEEITNQTDKSIIAFYQQLFTKDGVWCPLLDELPFFDTEGEKVGWLDICFIENEVFDEVKNMSDDKALRLDDFSMAFFQA